MTRDLKYKCIVPVSIKGFEINVFYVWFDALIGYLTFEKKTFK
jgi:methionyl-tRNA synthetase